EFNVQSGQTLVLAGFLSREDARNVDSVPGLGGVPVIGQLFRAAKVQRSDTELAVFVTPVVVSADHPDMVSRVHEGKRLVQEQFVEPPRVTGPVRNAPAGASSAAAKAWRPWDGAGGQWRGTGGPRPPLQAGHVQSPVTYPR